jgi:hypothetical protein
LQAQETIEQTKDEARGLVDTYLNFLEQIIASFPSGGTEFGEKLKGYAEKNIEAVREYALKLSQAKDIQDVLRIQTQFMQSQFIAFGQQTTDLGEACAKAAADAVNKPFSKAA